MNYLVTGGAGFIGSHLIEHLIAAGNHVLCVDDLSSGYISNLPEHDNISLIKKPVQAMEIDQLPELDGIFHLAAQTSVPKSLTDFYNSSANNLLGTLKVWHWAIKLNIPIVYASSSAIYGNLPIGSDTIDKYDILSPYAQDKVTMEHYAKLCWNIYKSRSIGLRFFNVYGPRQDPSNPYSGVISIFINRLLKNQPVTVNGGYQTRDFVYVKDIVVVMIRSMENHIAQKSCTVLNVGTGKSISIDILLAMLADIIEVKPEIIRKPLPPGDPERSGGTYQKLKDVLALDPNQFVQLEKGLIDTIDHIKK